MKIINKSIFLRVQNIKNKVQNFGIYLTICLFRFTYWGFEFKFKISQYFQIQKKQLNT